MGFISAFANLGSIGSTTKWTIKMYNEIKLQNKKLKPNKIFAKMIKLRLESFPLGSNDMGLDYNSHMLRYAEKAPGLAGLIIEILCAEAELHENSIDNLEEMIKPIFDKLEEADLTSQEKYGTLKAEHSAQIKSATPHLHWMRLAVVFVNRVYEMKK
jgi:hypothetical protein